MENRYSKKFFKKSGKKGGSRTLELYGKNHFIKLAKSKVKNKPPVDNFKRGSE